MRRRLLVAGLLVGLAGTGTLAAWLGLRGPARAHASAQVVAVERERFTRRVTAEGNLVAVQATPLSPPQVPGQRGPLKLAWLAPDGSAVTRDQVVLRFDPTELERQLVNGEADLAAARAKLARERIVAGAAEDGRASAADLAGRELEESRRFQPTDAEIFSRHQIVESQIDQALSRERRAHAQDAQRIEGRLTGSKLAVIDVERRQAQLTIDQARAGLSRLEVKAPHDGILVHRRNWRGELPQVGQQVWPGQSLAEIPDLAQMEAEVFVLEVDGGELREAMPATVIVEAQPGVEYAAKVKRVDKLAKPRVAEVPVQYFAVTLTLERTVAEVMKPGQRVRATLVLDVDEALVVPRQAVFEVDGETRVYRATGAGFEPVPVVLGPGTPGRVVIVSGLGEGDRIALRDPTRGLEPAREGAREGTSSAKGVGKAAP